MDRYFATSQFTDLGAREVGVIASTSLPGRDGHIVLPSGIDLTNYRKNPIVLFQHDPEQPIAACIAMGVEDGKLAQRWQFPPEGASTTADQACALAKAGILKGVSIGFNAIDTEPRSKSARGGLIIKTCELLETSLVSIPADTGAGVVARALQPSRQILTMFRGLPNVPAAAIYRAMTQMDRRGAPNPDPTMRVLLALEQIEQQRDYQARQSDLHQLEYSFEARQADKHELEYSYQARQTDKRRLERVRQDYSYQARQADLRRLAARGASSWSMH